MGNRMNEKEQPVQGTPPSTGQSVAGSPEDLNKRAQNDNPRANENIREDQQEFEDTTGDVGSEITDGEDA